MTTVLEGEKNVKIVYDKNMQGSEVTPDDNIIWHDVSHAAVDVYGFDNEGKELLSQRIPKRIASNINEGVLVQCGYAAGGRIRFWTNSKSLTIKVQYEAGEHPTCLCACAAHGFDLYIADEKGKETFLDGVRPSENQIHHREGCYLVDLQKRLSRLGKTENEGVFYTLNLPIFVEIKKLYLGLDKGSELRQGVRYMNEFPVLFYGSSITHGAAASRPGNTYEAFISQKYNLNYVNLGFSGSAKGEREMAKYIADRDMQVFVCDYDYNAPTPEHLAQTHYAFYETIREKKSYLPYVMISRPDFWRNPNENKKRREIILSTYEKAKSQGDENIYFIDGETLVAGDCYMSCTVDGIHPNDLGFYRMSQVIGKTLAEIMKI